MATIYEVSKLAGVAVSTVSRVINGNENVSDKTRHKVNKAMEQLGYKPSVIARSLASSRSDSVGVLVGELNSSFFSPMTGAIEKALRHHHKHTIVTSSHNEAQREKEGIEFLISRHCDALILHAEGVSDEYLIQLCQGKTPVVILNRFIPEVADRCIGLDNTLGGYLAAKSVLEKGHRDILYVTGPSRKRDAQNRLQGFQRALAEFRVEFDYDRIVEGNYLQQGGRKAFEYMHEKQLPCTAVICSNDEMASGVMASAREHGISIPEELSVFGFDNALISSYTYPTLSTINYPIREMATMAAQLILQDVYNLPKHPVQHLFEPTLIERDSVITRA